MVETPGGLLYFLVLQGMVLLCKYCNSCSVTHGFVPCGISGQQQASDLDLVLKEILKMDYHNIMIIVQSLFSNVV